MSKHWNAALFLAWIALFSGMCHAFGEPVDGPREAARQSTANAKPITLETGRPSRCVAPITDAEFATSRSKLLNSLDHQLGRQPAVADHKTGSAPKHQQESVPTPR